MIMHNAPPPGAILRESMADDLTLSHLAAHLEVSRVTLSKILNGSSGVTAPMAFKLAEAFPTTSPKLWMDFQTQYELSHVHRNHRKPIAPVRAA